jgi:oligopeptide transport system permease protein
VICATFFLLRALPGGPFDKEKKLPPEVKQNIEKKYHLDKPAYMQFAIYVSGILKGDLGPSYKYLQRDVSDIIKDTLPVSLKIGILAYILCIFFGIAIGGIFGFARRGEATFEVAASFGLAMPSFVLASLLVLVFSYKMKILPPALFEGWSHYILPVISLSIAPAFYLAKVTKTSVANTITENFVTFSRSKGVTGARLYLQILKASLSAVLGISGPLFAFLVTGSFIIETIFAIPGMGRYFVMAVTDRDYPTVMGITIVFTLILVVANIIADAVHILVDPRAREKQ